MLQLALEWNAPPFRRHWENSTGTTETTQSQNKDTKASGQRPLKPYGDYSDKIQVGLGIHPSRYFTLRTRRTRMLWAQLQLASKKLRTQALLRLRKMAQIREDKEIVLIISTRMKLTSLWICGLAFLMALKQLWGQNGQIPMPIRSPRPRALKHLTNKNLS